MKKILFLIQMLALAVFANATTCSPSVTIGAAPSGAICAGTSVTFTATPTDAGSTPTYQWKKGGVDIGSATGSTYTTTGLANGDVISVAITSSSPCSPTATVNS